MRYKVLVVTLALWAVTMMPTVRAQEGEGLEGPEQKAMTDTLQHALEFNRTRQASEWVNPDTGRSGAVVPVRTFEKAQRQPCREFITTIIIGGREEQGYGTACRQADGSAGPPSGATTATGLCLPTANCVLRLSVRVLWPLPHLPELLLCLSQWTCPSRAQVPGWPGISTSPPSPGSKAGVRRAPGPPPLPLEPHAETPLNSRFRQRGPIAWFCVSSPPQARG
jgi:surface antigen